MTPITPAFDTTATATTPGGGAAAGGGFPRFDAGQEYDDDDDDGDMHGENSNIYPFSFNTLPPPDPALTPSTTTTTRPLKTSRGLRLGQQMGQHRGNAVVTSTSADPGPSSSYNQSQQERLQGLQREMGLNIAMPEMNTPTTAATTATTTTSPTTTTTSPPPPTNGQRASNSNRLSRILPYNRSDAPSLVPSQSQENDWNRANRMAQSSLTSLSSAYRRPDSRNHTTTANSNSSHQHYDDSTASAQSVSAATSDSPSHSNRASANGSNSTGGHGGNTSHLPRELLLPAINGARAAILQQQQPQPRRTTSAAHLRNAREDLRDTSIPSDANAAAAKKATYDDASSSTRTSSPDDRRRDSSSSKTTNDKRPRSATVRKDALTDVEIVKLGAIDGQDPHSLLPTDGTPLTSKNVLTIALAKAQSAVTHDSGNNVPEAIHSYGQAVRLLQEVMERIAPRHSSSKKKSTRQEERRRLKVIHDTYTDRIRLLSLIYGPGNDGHEPEHSSSSNVAQAQTSSSIAELADAATSLPSHDRDQNAADSNGTIAGQPAEHVGTDDDAKSPPSVQPPRPIDAVSPPSTSISTSTIPMPSNESEEVLADKPSQEGDETDAASHHQRSDSDASFQSVASMPIGASASNLLNQPHSTEHQDGTSRSRSPQRNLTVQVDTSPSDPAQQTTTTTSVQPPATPYFDAQQQASQPTDDTVAEHHTDTDASPATQLVVNVEHSDTPPDSSRRQLFRRHQLPDLQRPRAATVSSPVASPSRLHALDEPAAGPSSQEQTPRLDRSSSSEFGASADTSAAIALSEASSPAMSSRRFGLGGEQEDALDEQAKASMRRRALSQPGSKRPPLPHQQSFQMSMPKAPPLPRMARKISLPGLNIIKAQQQGGLKADGPNSALSSLSPLGGGVGAGTQDSRSVNQRPYRFPSPSPSFTSGYHALVEDGLQSSIAAQGHYDAAAIHQTGLSAPTAQESLFPSGLASAQTYGMSSMHLSKVDDCPLLKQSMKTLNSLAATDGPPQPPLSMSVNPILRPFTQARALSRSIASSGFITSKLCVPSHAWVQVGTNKLAGLETKVRLIELVANGIDGIEKSGSHLLNPPKGQPGLAAVQSAGFAKQLEDFDALLIEVQNTFSKKLGIVDTVAGRKGSSLGSFGSKMARSIDRMALTNSAKNVDLPAAYIDSLNRLFDRAEVLHLHTATLLQSQKPAGRSGGGAGSATSGTDFEAVEAYANLPHEVRKIIETKLLRSSEFFSSVVIKIVLKDLNVLMDKAIKYSSVALSDGVP